MDGLNLGSRHRGRSLAQVQKNGRINDVANEDIAIIGDGADSFHKRPWDR